MSTKTNHYRSILKSSSLIGGASIINVLIGMVRVKFVAVLLGPSGVGLMGTYVTITSLISAVAGMGISTSGVRQISESYGTGDEDQIARTILSVRRVAWVTGTAGMALMALGAYWLSKWSFGNSDHLLPIACISVTVLLTAITAGQSCLLQGGRRIADLAKVSVVGAINGTLISIPCYYIWGMKGIVPSLILGSLAGLVTSWWFARRIPVKSIALSFHESLAEGKTLLLFGIPLMLSGLAGSLTTYLIRILMIQQLGLDGVGIYQAAFSLSGLIVNFVLLAMAADYFPRLTAVACDNDKVGKEVNAQTEVALLLAAPALLVTLVFAPFAIHFFYSGKFDAAVDILRWAVFGVFLRVVAWPIGYILLAKAKGNLFLMTEIFAGLLHLVAVWYCSKRWGLPGTGIAYAVMQLAYALSMVGLFLWLTKTGWTRSVLLTILGVFSLLVAVGLIAVAPLSSWVTWGLNLSIVACVSVLCLWRLSEKTGMNLQMILSKLGVKTHCETN